MALYVSQRIRQRNTLLAVLATAVIAGSLGIVIGRQQVPSISDRVAKVSTSATDIATGVERLDIEYEGALSGNGDGVETSVLEPLRGLRTEMQSTLDEAPWVTAAERRQVIDSFAAVESAAKSKLPPTEFTSVLQSAGEDIRSVAANG